MIGMLYKDLYLIKSTSKAYIICLGMFFALTLFGLYDISFCSIMFVVFLNTFPTTCAAYDEQSGWDKYAVATPAGRKGVVQGRYLFALTLWLGTLVLIFVLHGILGIIEQQNQFVKENILTNFLVVSAGLVMLDILLPLIFKFGAQKSRFVLMAVIAVVVAVSVAVTTIVGDLNASLIQLCILLPVLGLGGMVVSYFVSLSIYQRKEL